MAENRVRSPANPYIAGAPIKGAEMFFGRDDIFEAVRARLVGQHQDNVVVIFGQRRTGKTSVLYQMGRRLNAEQERYVAVLVDLQGLALDGMSSFLWELTRTIQRALRRDYQLRLRIPERADFQADARSVFRDNFLPALRETIGERRLLLMFDESVRFEEAVIAKRLKRDIFDYLRSLMQHEPGLSFIFSLGSKLEQMRQEYALMFNTALHLQVSFLDEAAARTLITEPVAGLYSFEEQAVERIMALTSRHPYFVQLLCHTLFTHWERERWERVTPEQVDAVLDEVTGLAVANLQYVWNEANRAEKYVLSALAEMGPEAAVAETLGRHLEQASVHLGRAEIAHALNGLERREVIGSPAHPSFSVEMIRRWLAREKPLAWVREELQALEAAEGVTAPEPIHRRVIDRTSEATRRRWDDAEQTLGKKKLWTMSGVGLTALISLIVIGLSLLIRLLNPPPPEVKTKETQVREIDGMTMVLVPEGPFLMGSDPATDACALEDEQPQHEVTLDAFWIDQTEVTNAQYAACVQAEKCDPLPDLADDPSFNGPDQPVVGVDWDSARAYCQWVGGDLPTEAQWEKAARGDEGRLYPWGDEFGGTFLNFCDANCPNPWKTNSYDDGFRFTTRAYSYPAGASPYGALNTSGNVLEWVLDLYSPSYDTASGDSTLFVGLASQNKRVSRGGSWGNYICDIRPARRQAFAPNVRNNRIGFRCALPVEPIAGTATPTPTPLPLATTARPTLITLTPTPTSRTAITTPVPIVVTPTPTAPPPAEAQFQLYWPVDSREPTQFFGENPEFWQVSFDLPGYYGVDLVAPMGGNVYAAYDGEVIFADYPANHREGLHIKIKHTAGDVTFETIYAHLEKSLVLVGQEVKAGERIALAGNTGFSSGPNLGFRLKIDGAQTPGYPAGYVDPWPYLEASYENPSQIPPTHTATPTLVPPRSNVRGIHGSAGMVAPPKELWSDWIKELQEMGIAWYVQLDDGDPNDIGANSTFAWAVELKQNGIEPIIRFYQGQMFPDGLNDQAFKKMQLYAAEGIIWVEIGNEPNLDVEWHPDHHDKLSWQYEIFPSIIVENWIEDAEKAVAAGARPGFYALKPTDWGGEQHPTSSSVMFYRNMFEHVEADPDLFRRFHRLFEPGKAWLAVHISTYEYPVDFDPFPPGFPPHDMCLRGYEIPLSYMEQLLGITDVVVMSTSGGVFTKDSDAMAGHERLKSHEEHAQRTVEMFDWLQQNSPLQAMCPWLISNESKAIGYSSPLWANDGWYDGAPPGAEAKPVVQAMKDSWGQGQ